MCPWIKIVPNCPMPELDVVVLIMVDNGDAPTCAYLTMFQGETVWRYDQIGDRVEMNDETEVTHWAPITLPESNTKDV